MKRLIEGALYSWELTADGKRREKMVWIFAILVTCIAWQNGWASDYDITGIGLRGGINIKDGGLPPTEKEDFQQYDVFATMQLPWIFGEAPSPKNLSLQLMGSAGALRSNGETGFITTLTTGLAYHNPEWRILLDMGIGVGLISQYRFGRQDIGGPFQFIAHGGAGVELVKKTVVGWRFHHMSDATIYGSSRGVDLHMLELRYVF